VRVRDAVSITTNTGLVGLDDTDNERIADLGTWSKLAAVGGREKSGLVFFFFFFRKKRRKKK
jgi:hypothetical protein